MECAFRKVLLFNGIVCKAVLLKNFDRYLSRVIILTKNPSPVKMTFVFLS